MSRIIRIAMLAIAVLVLVLFVPIPYFHLDVSNYYLAGFIFAEGFLFFIERIERERDRPRLEFQQVSPRVQLTIKWAPPIEVNIIGIAITNNSSRTIKDCEPYVVSPAQPLFKYPAYWIDGTSIELTPKEGVSAGEEDSILRVLHKEGLLSHTTDIDPSDAKIVAVVFGADSIPNKTFLACDLPKELRGPPATIGQAYVGVKVRINAEDFQGFESPILGVKVGMWDTFTLRHLGRLERRRTRASGL